MTGHEAAALPDNTLLDNDRIQDDLRRHLEREFGGAARDRYWAILEAQFVELGYRDYLGALQRYRTEHPQDVHLMSMSSYLVDYPFANRLYPGALDVLERLRGWGPTVILSDGDVVFQPGASDVLYVKALAAPFTVNTMPEGTLKALADHGAVGAMLPADGGDCEDVLGRFASAGIDVDALANQLQDEGAKSFVNSWHELMDVIARKSAALAKAS